jgi:pyrroloquinoline-quinone synthase
MKRFDAVVARHDLSEHPFYVAWRAGKLPREALAVYAGDYAEFIGTIETGWRALGDHEHAAVEREHARLWDRFRDGVGSTVAPPCAEARTLADVAREAFSDPVTALGALYAFEAQQPKTARSKLDGLLQHYELPAGSTAYFRAHADDYGERDGLSRRASALEPADVARAEAACEATCRAMWTALDGVMVASGIACV